MTFPMLNNCGLKVVRERVSLNVVKQVPAEDRDEPLQIRAKSYLTSD